ncbi:carbohydrate ABC transporter permease [Lacrimispora sp.]|uniref:carbohydrate ABC transporter permease n=1 Tax=Lacrimispora sp. TaxID=2719234 RepID=UPI002896562F|nr:sugar ABC transporter permease [Lacrimispora sp.]
MMKSHKFKSTYSEFFLVLPSIVFYLVFVVYPLLGGIYYSFTDWNGVNAAFHLVGLKNYFTLSGDKYVAEPLKNTFIYAFLSMILLNVLGLVLAVGLDRISKGKNLFRALLFVPAVLSSLVVGYIFSFIFSEPIADLGKSLGIDVIANNLLGSKQYSLYMGVLVGAWKMAGWYMVIYIAGLQNIDQSLYEAADIDGSTGWKKFRYVTFPLIAPAFTINMILSVERAFKEYDLMFALTGGGPGRSSELISLTIYGESFTNKRAGYGSALGVVLFLIIVAITLFQMFILRRRENDINY